MATYHKITILMAALFSLSVKAAPGDIPPPAYQMAAYSYGVPSAVLYAVALQESGTRLKSGLRPWPWTLNVAGEGYRFKDRDTACLALTIAIDVVGAKRVDAGLGQVNIGWNGHHFADACEALDPYKNLQVTAKILKTHYDASGDWIDASGRYHRPAGGAPAERYRAGFKKHLSRVLQVSTHDLPGALNTNDTNIFWTKK